MQAWLDRTLSKAAALGIVAAVDAPGCLADVIVRVSGIESPRGHIGCALFASEAGFPMDNSGRRLAWVGIEGQAATCRFNDVPSGSYAVSVVHDLNDNRRLDANFLGIPTEPWGVSNNVRPRWRAPRFDESRFSVQGGDDVTIDVRVAP